MWWETALAYMSDNAPWMWMGAGILLLAGEMVLPGIFLMWIGVASVSTAIIAFLLPGLGFEGHGLYFAVTATISIYCGNRFFYGPRGTPSDNALNNRGDSYVGRVFEVERDITDGRGAVKVGDGRWIAEGPDAPVGSRVRVVGVDGTVMTVEPVAPGED